MVHAYPFFTGVESAFEGMFGTGPESLQEIVKGADANPMHAEWRALDEYLCSITGQHAHDYRPVPRPSSTTVGPAHPTNCKPAHRISLHDMLL